MKKIKLLGWALMALASFSACTNDAEEIFAQENEIKLTSEITPSRVTSLDYQSTQIVEGQQIGVTITGAKSEHKNVAWNVGEEGELSNTGDAVFWANEDIAITAYHPYDSSWIGTSHEFSVSTDQSSEESYRNSDLLWVAATSSKTETAIPLIFSHKLAKINVTLKSEDIEDLSGATINICGTNITTNFNPVDGTLSAATANIQEIKAGVTSSTAYTASAIVVPQTVANGTKFIKITHNDRTFYYTLSTNKELKSGCSHNYTLTIKDKEVTTESDKITDWEDDDNEGDAEEENPSVINVEIAGNLYQSLRAAIGDNEYSITSLKITGNINSTDIGVIRRMAGRKKDGTETEGLLAYLDISEVNIVAGGDYYYKDELGTEYTTENNVVGDYMFYQCNLKNVKFPLNVTKIGVRTCKDNTSLESVIIPNGVEYIGMAAFCNCVNLKSIVIPNTVKEIYYYAFQDCDALTLVNIPNSVKNMPCAFIQCDKLEYIHLPENESYTSISYNSSPIRDCPSLKVLILPSNINQILTTPFTGTNIIELHINRNQPPTLDSGAIPSGTTIYVPKDYVNTYKSATVWKNLKIEGE